MECEKIGCFLLSNFLWLLMKSGIMNNIKCAAGGTDMGSYLNPGNFSFRGSLRSKIYVDKSKLIAKTNEVLCTEQKSYVWSEECQI